MNIKNNQQGLSSIEILIALLILIIGLTGAILVSFGNQKILADSENSSLALSKAQELLEDAQSKSRKDFNLVVPILPFTDGIFTKKTEVVLLPDFVTKKIIATVSWTGENNRNLSVDLSALVTNFEEVNYANTCNSVITGDWTNPQIQNSITSFGQLIGDFSNLYPITDLDVQNGLMFVSVNNQAVNNNSTFFVFNVLDPKNPVLLGQLDNASVSAGINAVQSTRSFVYIASGRAVSNDPNFGQLQIIDVSNPVSPSVIKTFKIPGITANNSSQGIGQSLFYKDGFIYFGLTKTGTGPEFNIIDVRDPYNPFWLGSFSVGALVNQIIVKNNFAYLATGENNNELIILDVSNPTSPQKIGSYNASGGSGNGKSLAIVGDALHLGRTVGDTEYFILDISNPTANSLAILGQQNNFDKSVNEILMKDYLAFLLSNDGLDILNLQNLNAIANYSNTLTLPVSGFSVEPSMDCEGDNIFVSSNSSSGQGFLYVIFP